MAVNAKRGLGFGTACLYKWAAIFTQTDLSMTDFTAARTHMVDSQIHTMGVVSDSVLSAFRTVQREEFVPADRRGIAYNDEDLIVAKGRVLMEPVTHARLLQAALPDKADTVLDVGGATGYSAAIFAALSSRVVAVEADPSLLSLAEAIWRKQGYAATIIPHQGAFAEGCPSYGPYSLIFLNGSVAEIPASLVDQLAPNGRMVAVVRPAGARMGQARIITKNAAGVVGQRILFDAAVPYLPGHEPRNGFVF